MDINVNVVNQDLRIATNLKCLSEGTQKFIKFIFHLDESWDGLTVFAQFIQGTNAYNQFLDAENSVFLPHEIGAGKCRMLLYGTGNEDVIATTNFVLLTINENGLVEDGQSTVITQSLYTQLVNIVQNNRISMQEALDATAAAIRRELGDLETELISMVGTPLVAHTASEMTDHSKIYVYVGSETGYQNGYWYFWNGTAWAPGTEYISAPIDIATLAEIKAYINY